MAKFNIFVRASMAVICILSSWK